MASQFIPTPCTLAPSPSPPTMSSTHSTYSYTQNALVNYGLGSLATLPEMMKTLGVSRALIITGTSLSTKTDVISRAVAVLGDMHVGTFTEIGQHAVSVLRDEMPKRAQR